MIIYLKLPKKVTSVPEAFYYFLVPPFISHPSFFKNNILLPHIFFFTCAPPFIFSASSSWFFFCVRENTILSHYHCHNNKVQASFLKIATMQKVKKFLQGRQHFLFEQLIQETLLSTFFFSGKNLPSHKIIVAFISLEKKKLLPSRYFGRGPQAVACNQ